MGRNTVYMGEAIVLNLKRELEAIAGPMSTWAAAERELFRQLSEAIKKQTVDINNLLRSSELLEEVWNQIDGIIHKGNAHLVSCAGWAFLRQFTRSSWVAPARRSRGRCRPSDRHT